MKCTSAQYNQRAGLRWRLEQPGEMYWVHKPEHTDPYSEGYIGVALSGKGSAVRLARHIREKTLPEYTDDCILDVLFKGPSWECLNKEAEYRPLPITGWNLDRGGGMPREWLRADTRQRFFDEYVNTIYPQPNEDP